MSGKFTGSELSYSMTHGTLPGQVLLINSLAIAYSSSFFHTSLSPKQSPPPRCLHKEQPLYVKAIGRGIGSTYPDMEEPNSV